MAVSERKCINSVQTLYDLTLSVLANSYMYTVGITCTCRYMYILSCPCTYTRVRQSAEYNGWVEALVDKVHVHVHKQGEHIPHNIATFHTTIPT